MMTLAPLQPALDSFRDDWEARVGPEAARFAAGQIEALRASGLVETAAKAGDAWPGVPLTDALGKGFDLAALMARGPVVVTFYRGGWCPYCNLELRAWQERLADLKALGATLVAISPELPDHALTTAEKNALAFPVLSDAGGAQAQALGIRFAFSEALRAVYEKSGNLLPEKNGDGSWTLPVPATFVVARGGRIAAAFIEPDYRKRTDPATVLALLQHPLEA